MSSNFRYADIHCHPNLKTFGHSFDNTKNGKSDIWHNVPASPYLKMIQKYTGITKFSQTDLSTMALGGAKIALVSLYPFEKGFFINKKVKPAVAAALANWGIEIGYNRVRNIQQHTDYFSDLQNEYSFLINGPKEKVLKGITYKWEAARDAEEVLAIASRENNMAVIFTIEGAHVFNSGLKDFGKEYSTETILDNVRTVKKWDYPPLFIGLAHNFNNDLCGHAESLQRLGGLVDQKKNMNTGLTSLGKKVIDAFFDESTGRKIPVDLKHMSLIARKEYYGLLKRNYTSSNVPIVVSHGGVTGVTYQYDFNTSTGENMFNTNPINFYDEEIIEIAASKGLFGIQMDIGINSDLRKIKHFLKRFGNESEIKRSARIIFNQIQHIASVCDAHQLRAWDTPCLGTDFDGSINPFPGIFTASGLRNLAREMIPLADEFLKSRKLNIPENFSITAEEVVDKFMYGNTARFVNKYYRSTW